MSANQPRFLGRLPVRHDPRTLQLRNYLSPTLPPPPVARHWETSIPEWGVMGNNRFGNCVIATAGHMRLCWRANELDDTKPISDAAVIELSRRMGALNGYNILDRLKYWRKRGMWGNKLTAFAQIDPTDLNVTRHAVNIFGAADIGLNLPKAWKDAEIWDIGIGRSYDPGSWGGHSVPIVAYDESFLYLVTWGRIQQMRLAALSRYCDEAYAVINTDWTALDNITPSGVDLASLEADLQAITQ